MNQTVQVLDGYIYDVDKQAMKLLVMNGGQLIDCYILPIKSSIAEDLYIRHQFDIEELIAEQVSSEQWNESGDIIISPDAILA
ncbi:hypothetical protein [Aliiglaciecola sp. LCG003]|uniref:hypothetical protein n=1 Tax=Aliiglaciecola sp. LCG003 TaxID=3053655 RepID=UPI002573B14B|nr:hypothetical protein [Aliiglaciecola sp. LCG003]WJG09484.1 hypothetical protein QR722_00135 [Aliiglaciecola sp. LCG003]